MPIIRIDMIAGRTGAQKREIAKVLCEEMARIVACDVADVQLVFNEVERESWAVGGKLLGGDGAAV